MNNAEIFRGLIAGLEAEARSKDRRDYISAMILEIDRAETHLKAVAMHVSSVGTQEMLGKIHAIQAQLQGVRRWAQEL